MKIKTKIQGLIDIFNSELNNFAIKNNDVKLAEIKNSNNDYTEGALSFDNFTVILRCHHNRTGYGFMEEPVGQETNVELFSLTFETRFKFNFCEIPFSIYDIHNVVNDNNFRTLCFHNISNEEDVLNAVKAVLDFIKRNKKTIGYIDSNKTLQDNLITAYFEDERVFNKDFDETAFNEDIKGNAELHEMLMGLHFPIETGVYKFLTTGNYKTLAKQFEKAEKKNNLITFEKRYQKHLYDTSFEKSNTEISNSLIKKQKRATATCIFYVCIFIISAVLSIELDYWSGTFAVNQYYKEALFLGTSSFRFEIIIILFAPFFLLTPLALKVTRLKNKVNRLFFNEKYDKIIILGSLILIIASIFMTLSSYKNHGIYIKNNQLYVDNAVVSQEDRPEFIYIKGCEYEELNGTTVYSTDPEYRELYYVFYGNYEDYTLCEIFEGDGYVTNDILNRIKRADCKITTYDTIEDFAEDKDFVLDE